MSFTNTVLAATLQRRDQGYLDVISSQIPLFEKLRSDGQYKTWDGGTPREFNLEYAFDTDEPSYDGYDNLPLQPQDNVKTATANIKQYQKPIVISGIEKRINSGKRVFNLLEQKEKNALNSLTQQMSDHVYQDGTGNNSKRITGLKASVSATPTSGTLYGINRANDAWFRNYQIDTNAAAMDISDGNPVMARDMELLRIRCGRLKIGGKGNRYPNLIVCTEEYFQRYQHMLSVLGQRFVDTKVGDVAFDALKFHNGVIMHDEDMPDDAGGDAQAYFLNTQFITLEYHPQANFSTLGMERHINQDAFSDRVIWNGELLVKNPAKQGLHLGIAAVQA